MTWEQHRNHLLAQVPDMTPDVANSIVRKLQSGVYNTEFAELISYQAIANVNNIVHDIIGVSDDDMLVQSIITKMKLDVMKVRTVLNLATYPRNQKIPQFLIEMWNNNKSYRNNIVEKMQPLYIISEKIKNIQLTSHHLLNLEDLIKKDIDAGYTELFGLVWIMSEYAIFYGFAK